jgi:hypothetical protein
MKMEADRIKSILQALKDELNKEKM